MSTAEHLLAYVDDAALERARTRRMQAAWASEWRDEHLLGLWPGTMRGSGPEPSLLAFVHPNDVLRAFDRMKPGSWRDVVRLPHEEVEIGGFTVPAYTWEDEERARWRRRKWWGPLSTLALFLPAIWMPMWHGRPFTDARWIGTPRHTWGPKWGGRGRVVKSFHLYVPPDVRAADEREIQRLIRETTP